MTRRSIVRPGRLALILIVAALGSNRADAQDAKPFEVPRDRAAWESQVDDLRREAAKAMGVDLAVRPSLHSFQRKIQGVRSGLVIESLAFESDGKSVEGYLLLPEGSSADRKVSLILDLVAPGGKARDEVEGPGFDGQPTAITLGRFGFAILAIDASLDRPHDLRVLREVLAHAISIPRIDSERVGVVGFGPSGPTALALMAIDDRIGCGVAAIEARDFGQIEPTGRPHFVETLAALCAPRDLDILVGEALPIGPKSLGKALERAVKGTYKVFGPQGLGLGMNIYGEFTGHDSVATRLQWMAALEHLDKHLRPQGRTPLGHEREPEPAVDDRFIDLAERGIAGWSAEMSQRPKTWSWSDGVISCKPGPGEFGWLRAPIEVDDFILRVEWKVPEKGNGGIFLRAKPVTWALPPTEATKPKLQSLGLDWPSRTGLELQAQDDQGIADRYSSGSLYRHVAPANNPTFPPGQWNRYTVRARGPRVEVWSNGRQVLDTSLLAHSVTLPDPPLRGFIGLQNHGSPTDYRNVKLLKID